jgi:hypothetical protein
MKFLILFFITLGLFGQVPTVTTSPRPATAITGGTVTLTSSISVTWGLVAGSMGTLNATDSTHATYTAPSGGIPAPHMIAGCPAMPNDSVWHTPLDGLPSLTIAWPESANWVNHVSSDNNFHFGDTEWPGISIADANAGTTNLKFYYGAYGWVPQTFPVPTYLNYYREGGDMRGDANQADHHTFTMRISDCHSFEVYGDNFNGYTRNCQTGGGPNGTTETGCNAVSGDDWVWSNYTPQGGTGAAGIPDSVLTLHVQEVRDGTINHALRFTLCTGCIGREGRRNVPNSTYWPATQYDQGGGFNDPNYPPYGAIFRLKASITAAAICGTGSDLPTKYCNNIVDALHKYGLIEGDASSGPDIVQVGVDCLEDPSVMSAIGKVGSRPTSIFEPVDMSSLKIQSGQPLAGSYAVDITQGGANYVKPQGYAVVTAAPVGGGTTINVHVTLQPLGIGFYNSTLNVEAGIAGFQIPYWTTGTASGFQMNAGATWSITQSAGTGDSITSGGVYTPPASVPSFGTAILTATSTVDPSVKQNLTVLVFPAPSDGNIRIDTGRSSNWTDRNGHLWLADKFIVASSSVASGGDFPAPWKYDLVNNPEEPVYESTVTTTGNAGDFFYRLVAPNGHYKVRLMFGYACQPWGCGSYNVPSTQPPGNHSPLMLLTQGQIQMHSYNFADDPNVLNLQQRHADAYIPAVVTNNMLNIALMGYFDDMTQYCELGPNPACSNANTPYLNGLVVSPDNATAPYWALDCDAQTQTLPLGSTLKFYVQDWYTGFNDPVWSIAGPGSIDQTGLYTAPRSAANYLPVLIQAQSASHPQYSASRRVWLTGGNTISFK